MAPRETRVESMSFGRLSAASSERLLQSTLAAERSQDAMAAVTRRSPATALRAPGSSAAGAAAPAVSTVDEADVERQAQAMRAAADSGVPFCQVCRKS